MASLTNTTMEIFIADYGMSILLILGNIGNILVIVLFRRYHRNVSSMYLSSGALFNILHMTFNIPLIIYSYHYADPATYSLPFCKFQAYFSLVLGQTARYVIVFACLDRYLATNRKFLAKNTDRVLLAKRLIVLSVLMWSILDTHHLFFTTISEGDCGKYGNYYLINRIFLFISFNLVPPVLMIIFGYLAVRQLRRIRICVRPISDPHHGILLCRKDRKFLTMILTEVCMYCLTTILYLIMNLQLMLRTNGKMKNAVKLSDTESLLMLCSVFITYINHAAPFYLYLGLSREFRQDFIRCAHRNFFHVFRNSFSNIN